MQEEKKEIPTPAVLLTMVAQMNFNAYEKERALQCEESGSQIARLQGYLAGVRCYKQLMRDNGYTFDIKFDGTTERALPFFNADGCELDLHELRVTVSCVDELTESSGFAGLKKLWGEAVDRQKDWLFYKSEKGRDLHFVKGWLEGMTVIDKTIERLRSELAREEKEASESLPFEGDDIGQTD